MEKDEKRKINWSKVGVAIVAIVAFAIVVALIFLGFATPISVFDTNGRVAADQVVLREMNDTLHEVNSKLDSMPQVGVHDSAEPAESSTPAEEVPSYTQEELNDMVFSRNFDDILTVASSPNATELQLTLIAQECVTVIGSDVDKLMPLVVALVSNPNCTTTIVTTLANINYYEVWLIVAQSDLCSETTLLLLAEQCSPYNNNNDSGSNLLVPIVSAICENDAISMNVIQVLNNNYYAHIQDIVRAKTVELLQPEILETPHP